MFKCKLCGSNIGPGVSPTEVVTQVREKTYPERMKGREVIDKGGYGVERAQSLNACTTCANQQSEPITVT